MKPLPLSRMVIRNRLTDPANRHTRFGGLRMLEDIVYALLHDPIEIDFRLFGQGFPQIANRRDEAYAGSGLGLFQQSLDRPGQAEAIQLV
jgi:hypothetical protein